MDMVLSYFGINIDKCEIVPLKSFDWNKFTHKNDLALCDNEDTDDTCNETCVSTNLSHSLSESQTISQRIKGMLRRAREYDNHSQ